MRTQLVQTVSLIHAQLECPWAEMVVKVEGGYLCFESIDDYETWNNQK